MIERADGGPLEDLHTAIQAFSNALSSSPEQVGVVTHALIVWEEVSFTDDGTPARTNLYAALGDQATPNNSLGMALNLLRTLERDIIGSRCSPDCD